jgi:hypothetical protein
LYTKCVVMVLNLKSCIFINAQFVCLFVCSVTCNIGHVSYRLQFIYYNTTYNVWTSTQYNIINSFISIQPLGWFSRNQNPVGRLVWLWHAASWASSFLVVGCHCFPLPLDVPTFSTRCLHVQRRGRPLAVEGGTLRGWEMFRQISSRIRQYKI